MTAIEQLVPQSDTQPPVTRILDREQFVAIRDAWKGRINNRATNRELTPEYHLFYWLLRDKPLDEFLHEISNKNKLANGLVKCAYYPILLSWHSHFTRTHFDVAIMRKYFLNQLPVIFGEHVTDAVVTEVISRASAYVAANPKKVRNP